MKTIITLSLVLVLALSANAQQRISGESPMGSLDIRKNTRPVTEETVNLVWISPNPDIQDNKTYTDDKLTIKLKAVGKTGLQKDDFMILLNGSEASSSRSGDISLKGTTFQATVTLREGKNYIQVKVGNARSKTFHAIYSSLKPNLYVLAIAPSYQKNETTGTLNYTDDDARDIASTFRGQGGKGVYNKVFVDEIVGTAATAAEIQGKLEELSFKEMNERDVLLVFISSHGFMNGSSFRIKGDNYNPARKTSTSVSSDFMMESIKNVKCRKKFVFIDACYSGGARDDEEINAINTTIEALTNKQSGIVTFTSSSGSQKSWEHTSWQNGAFTYAIIKGLTGQADKNYDHQITIDELNQYISREVPKLVKTKYNEFQNPKMYINGLDKNMPIFVW